MSSLLPVWAEECPILNYQREIEFSGLTLKVKSGNALGPRKNNWTDDVKDVWVDDKGFLHLTVNNKNGIWYSTEVISNQKFGYGTYRFYVEAPLDLLDENLVLGLFFYCDRNLNGILEPRDGDREIDIEFTREGNENNLFNAKYVIHPLDKTLKTNHKFLFKLFGNFTTHQFNIKPEQVEFQSLHGHYKEPTTTQSIIQKTSLHHPGLAENNTARIHINFWLHSTPLINENHEIIIRRIEYEPLIENTKINNWSVY